VEEIRDRIRESIDNEMSKKRNTVNQIPNTSGCSSYSSTFPSGPLLKDNMDYYTDAKDYLNEHYPEVTRGQVFELDLKNKKLKGCLKVESFTNLETLKCSDNCLSSIDFPHNFEKLTTLEIKKNIFKDQSLSMFSGLVNLENLDVSENKFIGSLEPLKDIKNLKNLNISKTYLEPTLEYTKNLIEFYCSCSNNDLTTLNLTNSTQLVKLDCSHNKLTELDINKCSELVFLYCNNNLLKLLNLSHNEKLEELNLASNNFYNQNLSFLAHLTELRRLELGENLGEK
ncbi:12277_t:CDS:1, partial [Ambispora gerdemannii]